jgi:hypothetical protein
MEKYFIYVVWYRDSQIKIMLKEASEISIIHKLDVIILLWIKAEKQQNLGELFH